MTPAEMRAKVKAAHPDATDKELDAMLVKAKAEHEAEKEMSFSHSNAVRGVEIFAPGTHNGDPYTEADIDDLVSAFGELDFRPAIKIGHAKDAPGAPAYGWVTNLRKAGGKLVADFESMHDSVITALKDKRYDRVSSEIYFNLKRGGKQFRRALKAVALLGADVPAVAGLKPRHKMEFRDAGEFETLAACEQALDAAEAAETAILEAEVAALEATVAAFGAWDESRHPRRPGGSVQGGEFAPIDLPPVSEMPEIAKRAREVEILLDRALRRKDEAYADELEVEREQLKKILHANYLRVTGSQGKKVKSLATLAEIQAFTNSQKESTMTVKELQAKKADLEAQLAKLKQDDAADKAQVAKFEQDIAAFGAQIGALEAAEAATAENAALKTRLATLEQESQSRKVADAVARCKVPAFAADLEAIYAYAVAHPVEKVKHFAVGKDSKRVESEKTLVEVADSLVTAINASAAKLFTVVTAGGSTARSEGPSEDAGNELNDKALARVREGKAKSYDEAMDAVLAEDRELAVRYHEQQSAHSTAR